MTEHEFFTQSVQHNIIDHSRICGAILASGNKRKFRASRVLLPIAACFLCIVIVVASIPAARAEVLSWFGFSTSPSGYMSKDPDAREDVAELDALISSAAGQERITVTDEGDADRLSELLKQRLDVSLSETMYDGDSVYVTMRFGKGFGVWLVENYTGGSAASVIIPPERLNGFFSPAVPESYQSGEETYYSHTSGELIMTLPDGSAISGPISIAEDEAFLSLQRAVQAEPQNVDALVAQYLAANDVKAFAALKVAPEMITAFADETGYVRGKLSLLLQIELDSPMTTAPTTVLEADIGEMRVNALVYRDFITGATGSTEEVTWTGETILTHFDDSDVDESTYGNNVYTNRVLVLDGLKMKALGAEVDATGLRRLEIEITYPESWTDETIRQFHHQYGIQFKLLINGEAGDWSIHGGPRYQMSNPPRILWHCRQVQFVPLALLPHITELTLIPHIRYCAAFTEIDYGPDGAQAMRGKTTQLTLDAPFTMRNDYSGEFTMETTYFPQYALSLLVPQD